MDHVENFEEYTIPKRLIDSSKKLQRSSKTNSKEDGSNMNHSIRSILDGKKSINSSSILMSPTQRKISFKNCEAEEKSFTAHKVDEKMLLFTTSKDTRKSHCTVF